MGQERSETKKTRFHELIETETRMVVARVWGWREGEMLVRVPTSSCKMNKFWESNVQHGDYS